MRRLYKILFLIAIFCVSLWFFGSNMDEVVFDIEVQTVEMKAATLPTMTVITGEEEINLLHGYSSNLDVLLNRENVIPIGTDKTFFLKIDEQESVVRRLKYELVDVATGDEVDSGTFSAFDTEGEGKQVKIKLKADLKKDSEYAIKVTLITSQSKRIYYDFRIKMLDKAYLTEKLDFILDFHTKTMSENEEDTKALIPYLEVDRSQDNSSFARVNIHSSYFMMHWGDLQPKVLTEIIPSVKEISKERATVELDYIVELPSNTAMERYRVKEYYRVRYLNGTSYLLNYEREMESLFDISLASLSQSDFKLGVTAHTDMELVSNSDCSQLAFIRNRELWSYGMAENKLVRVFSFADSNLDVRSLYDQHDIRILKMDEAGNLNFLVYGYMNRGEYEGRVGVVLYKYYKQEGRLEELIYIPVNSTYQILKEELGSFGYMNDYDVFYFMVYGNLYSFNLITKEFAELATQVNEETFVFSMQDKYVAYQQGGETDKIRILDLEHGERKALYPKEGEFIRLLGRSDDNMIYGYGIPADARLQQDGTVFLPLYRLEICNLALDVLKSYEKEGYYITKTETEDNLIRISRCKKTDNDSYTDVTPEYILNQSDTNKEKIVLAKRVTDLMLTEYYISFPSTYVMLEIPEVSGTRNTVLEQDTTTRIQAMETEREQYYMYYYGKVHGIYENAGEAVQFADELVGMVMNEEGKLVWERGVKSTSASLSELTPIYVSEGRNSIQAALEMVLSYKSVQVGIEAEELAKDLTLVLNQYVKAKAISLTGASLDQVLYYTYCNQPVFAMKNTEEAVVIVAYDANTVTYIDPAKKAKINLNKKEAEAMFEKAGNLFISFMP